MATAAIENLPNPTRRLIVERLVRVQWDRDWLDREMAATLGISRVHWNQLKNRTRFSAGWKVISAAYARFPEVFEGVLP